MSSKKDLYNGSPCIGCPRNVQKAQGVRRDGKVQCCLDVTGQKMPRDAKGYQLFHLVEPIDAGTVCVLNGQYARQLITAAREARTAKVA